jgi:hypothetical protein
MPDFDVVGVGLNATDTLLIVPHFPAYAGNVPFAEEMVSPGGQVGQRHSGLRAAWLAHQIHRSSRRGERLKRTRCVLLVIAHLFVPVFPVVVFVFVGVD